MTTTIDTEAIGQYLDFAQLQAVAGNDWGEGFWMGRAIEYAQQNAVDLRWLADQTDARGLDKAVIPVPKPGYVGPTLDN